MNNEVLDIGHRDCVSRRHSPYSEHKTRNVLTKSSGTRQENYIMPRNAIIYLLVKTFDCSL